MLRNQNGFTYPVTMCMIILLSALLVIRVDQLLIEKRMLKETETILKQDYYLLSTIDKLSLLLANNENEATQGTIHFKDGQASFTTSNLSEYEFEIVITILVGEDNKVLNGKAVYDRILNKIINWTEVN